jgi:hypothetical protein
LAQYPVYKAVTVKTNILTWFNASVDFPILKRISGEIGYRYFPEVSGPFPISGFSVFRANFKYNFTFSEWKRYVPSCYFFTGLNSTKQELTYYEPKYTVVEEYSALEMPLGVGLRFRRTSFWFAFEYPIFTFKNRRYSYVYSPNHISDGGRLLPDYGFHFGIALTLINIKLPFRETTLHKWIFKN